MDQQKNQLRQRNRNLQVKLMLKIEKISVRLGDKQILDNLNLEIQDGEFLSLLGPSGCGKSTLLKAICGFVPLQSGKIYIGEHRIDQLAVHLRNIVMVFQDLRLFPHMVAWENVAFPLKMQKIGKQERKDKAYEWLKLVNLEGLEHRKIYALSGGQQQRVALARAFAARPKILLLDEPFSGLDEDLRREMQHLLMVLHQKHQINIIFVTHDQNEARILSDRIVMMNEGQVQ